MISESFEKAVSIFRAGVGAVSPYRAVKKTLRISGDILRAGEHKYSLERYDRIYVLGAGKCAGEMARAVEAILGERIWAGMINTVSGRNHSLNVIEVTEAGHPVPDSKGVEGTEKILELADAAGERDLVIGLISGGGSSLLVAPVEGISLRDLEDINRLLLKSGAPIEKINVVRKHLSRVKGGRLAGRIYPATVCCLVVSDVVGDRLETIASGPFFSDPSTYRDALEILDNYGLRERVPASVIGHLEAGGREEISETPKTGDRIFARIRHLIAADNLMALESCSARARQLGYRPVILSAEIEGEAGEAARGLMSIAKSVRHSLHPGNEPVCLLAGGEATVTVRGEGKGGRNQEFVLAAAREIAGEEGITVLSAGSDGIDGPTEAAGALADGTTPARARKLGMDAGDYLLRNDSYHFFEKLGDLLITGPTGTNVMDLRVILIE